MNNRKRRHNTTRTCRGKVRYRDKAEATEALHRIATSTRHHRPTRAYECPSCNGYHLTKEPAR
jgi:hypothetical protein